MKSRSEELAKSTRTVGDETVMEQNIVTSIKYCDSHFNELINALMERNLGDKICNTPSELVERLRTGGMDPLLESSNSITTAALHLFGTDVVLQNGGCPLCTFGAVVSHIADHMATKYLRSN